MSERLIWTRRSIAKWSRRMWLLYRPSSNWSLKVKHAGAFCQRQLAAAACETAPLYGLTSVRTFAKFHVTRSQSTGEFAMEVSSANVGTSKTNFWLIATVRVNECSMRRYVLDDPWNLPIEYIYNLLFSKRKVCFSIYQIWMEFRKWVYTSNLETCNVL